MMLRHLLLAVVLLAPATTMASAAMAQGTSATVAPANAAVGPTQSVAALNDALLTVMKAGRATPFAQRVATLTPVVQRVFDLPLLLQNSIGPGRWPSIPDAQKAQLMDLFTQFTVGSYVANFDSFSGEQFVVAPDLRHVGRDVVVQTRIVGSGGDGTRLDYVMRETDGGWQVVDILLDGSISRVAVMRSDYRALLAQGDASKLIDSLRGKIADFEAGAAP